jgi:hypothetical protein
MEIVITPRGAKCLRAMILSCGTAGCFEAIKMLESVSQKTSLTEIGLDKSGEWRMSAFQRLQWYANDKEIKKFDAEEIVRYFGGTLHIEIMERIANHAGLGQYLGKDVGLVTHVLLPLQDGKYQNAGHTLEFENFIHLNPKEPGKSFYHLGAVVNVEVNSKVVRDILAEQARSEIFIKSLEKISGTVIKPPKEYLAGLKSTTCKVNN